MENQPFREILFKNKENIENPVNNINKEYKLLLEKYKQKVLQNQELEKQVEILYNLLHGKSTKELLQYVYYIKVSLAKIRKTEKIVKAAIEKFEAEKQNFLQYLKKISNDIKSSKNDKIKLMQVIQHYKTQYSELIQYAQSIEEEKSELEERNQELEKLYLRNNSGHFVKTSLEEVGKVRNSPTTMKDKALKQGHHNNSNSIPFGFSYKEPEYMHFSGGPFFSDGDFLSNHVEEDEKNNKIAKLEKKLEETMKQLIEMRKNFNQLREKTKEGNFGIPDIGDLNGFEDQESDSLDISDLEKYINDDNWE